MRKLSLAHKQFLRFVFAGLCNTGVTYGLYLALLTVTNYMLAYSVSYVVGIFISYLFNSLFVFNTEPSKRTALRFPLIYLFQYVYGSAFLWLFVRVLGLDKKVAMLFVILSSTLLSFVLLRRLFQKRQ